MNSNLLFDFTVDKAAKTVFIKREFAAGLSLVWDAFTKQEILYQWNAHAPYCKLRIFSIIFDLLLNKKIVVTALCSISYSLDFIHLL